MKDIIENTIDIQAPPKKVYAYVSQPWRWHEWHPSSKSADDAGTPLAINDTFGEAIEIEPLSPLPLKLKKQVQYRVIDATPPTHWCVEGEMSGGWLRIEYTLAATESGTTFTRCLTYEPRGINRLFAPFLKSRMRDISTTAMHNLKQTCEADS